MRIKDYEFETHTIGLMYHCPVCGHHAIPLVGEPKWNFDGNYDKPTITPSVKCTIYLDDVIQSICHHYIRDGNIEFLADCTHNLKGQTIPLPEILI